MSKILVNLTIPAVNQEVEDMLETYPHHPYQEAFAHPDCRQDLIAYVLNRIPNHYILVEAHDEIALRESAFLRRFLEETWQIKTIIHSGINEILLKQAQDIHQHIPQPADPAFLASDWFG